ncbi:MAG: adenosylcobinamide-phosphate synthase CbiB [Janthinobacterium lividum]
MSVPEWLRIVCVAVAPVWIALAVDRWLGEPPVRAHPVVWMGNYLGAVGRRIAPVGISSGRRAGPFVAGALAWCGGAMVVAGTAWGVRCVADMLPWWAGAVLVGVLLKPLLAWRMLRDEVLAVDAALAVSLDAGRAQLARLVSRDVRQLSEGEVRESAIESLAENFNDSVVAPVFWFLLLGLPGAALYRFANTADAMWGYLGVRNGRDWTWAGKWAARADDALSWIPARLTALLVRPVGLMALRDEARQTPSPNSGWPMVAMALRLGVRLGKPGVYVLHAAGRVPEAVDVLRAARVGGSAVFWLGLEVLVVEGLVVWGTGC